ncbi:MAG: type II toxin-antitoxin system RelE/ParE family toxin [Methyloprofundus sp.]|nr:type II toxin-antitoxin system RelE/ParE family toxin [Methyloprofundus sp.]
MRISYTPESIDDLKRFREFIEVKNPLASQRIATTILKGISQLKTFPYLGVAITKSRNSSRFNHW